MKDIEQLKQELAKKWGMHTVRSYGNAQFDFSEHCLSDLSALLAEYKEMILREELINYTQQFYSDEITCIRNVDEYLKNVKK